VDDQREHSTAAGLEQGYVVTPSDARFLLLFTFLKKNLKKKVPPSQPDLASLS
jgi:ATP-dependent RNA helicase DDX18/HAS1